MNEPIIPYGRQFISDEDVAAVLEVLRSPFLTQGPAVPAFEDAVAKQVGAQHAVAVNSATSALHIACMALGVGPGDTVWTSPNSFVASANCARYCGADVDFVDIDPVTYNFCAQEFHQKLEAAEKTNTLPKVIIPVHFAGQPCDMAEIFKLAQRYDIRIIEDASHAIGATYGNTNIGDCTYSDIVIFSFHPVKIITTAEGGVALTQDEELALKMRLLRSHGVTRDKDLLESEGDGPWYYEQQDLGYNYRLTDVQASLGTSQLSNLAAWIGRRHEIADRYDNALKNLPVSCPSRENHSRSALHLYPIQVEDRLRVFNELRSKGIGVNVHYIPIHTQPYYRDLGFQSGQFPISEAYYAHAISLPMFATLSETEQDRVIQALRETLL